MPKHITSGRCLECRRRKRKCDELRPRCTLCVRAGTTCTYQEQTQFVLMYGEHRSQPPVTALSSPSTSSPKKSTSPPNAENGNRHGELHVRRSKDTPSGTYHTFTTRPARLQGGKRGLPHPSRDVQDVLCKLTRIPSPSDSYRLACNFGSLLRLPGSYYWILGNWSQYVPQRIGNSPLLDLSVTATLASQRSRLSGTEAARKEAYLTYGRALHKLKDDVAIGKSAVTGDFIAAMHLLQSCELALDDTVHTWNAHVIAAVACISAQGPSWCKGEFERAMFYATYATVSTNLRLHRYIEVLDTPEWHIVGLPPTHHSSSTYQHDDNERRRRIITVVPRLTSLVRSLRRTPTDPILIERVKDAIIEVVALDRIQPASAIPPEAEPIIQPESHVLPIVLQYPNMQGIIGHCYHWALRIAISGMCQSVYACGIQIENFPSIGALRAEEHECAMLICMSLPHLSSLTIQLAAGSLFPLQMAWVGLWRASMREAWEEEQAYESRLSSSMKVLTWLEERIATAARMIGYDYTRSMLMQFAENILGDGRVCSF